MSLAYYNDNDLFVVKWLRKLSLSGEITYGQVDKRSITEIQPKELASYKRVHLFAGIGGWDYALQLAGWPEELPVWTGSCPCQPFSVAGKRKGINDKRHLWPEFYRLIKKQHPTIVFGEQVSGKDSRKWFRQVKFDLEELGYRVAIADLCAASVGAGHQRHRLYWVADTFGAGCKGLVQKRESLRLFQGKASTQRNNRIIPSGIFDIPDPDDISASNGLSKKMGILHAYGNSIVPQVAAVFIRSYMDVVGI